MKFTIWNIIVIISVMLKITQSFKWETFSNTKKIKWNITYNFKIYILVISSNMFL